jgi:hypothetical protein
MDRHAVPYGGFAGPDADLDIRPATTRHLPPMGDLERAAAQEVETLIDDLEPSLDSHQRRLLHQLRLAAETLGAVRASVQMKRYSPI